MLSSKKGNMGFFVPFFGAFKHVPKPASPEYQADVEMPPPPVPPRKLLGAFAKAPKFIWKLGWKIMRPTNRNSCSPPYWCLI